MRILNISILLVLFLSGCGSFTKTQNIVSFTDVLSAEAPNTKIYIPERQNIEGSGSNLAQINIAIKDIEDKQKFDKILLPTNISAEPLIEGNTIYVICSNGSVHAYDLTSHKELWQSYFIDKKTKDRFYGGGIAYSDDKLYVTHGSQNLVVLNAQNGRRITSSSLDDILIKAPVIHGDFIYLLTLNNHLVALSKDAFTLVWDHAGAPEKLTYGSNHSSISLDYKNRLFVSYSSGQIYLLDSRDGTPLWQYDLSSEQNMPGLFPVNMVGAPILDKNFAYLADSIGKLYKFDFEKDKKIWDRNIPDIQTLNKVGNALLVTTNGRQAAAIDESNGQVIWATDIVDDISDLQRQSKEYKAIEEYNRSQEAKAKQKKAPAPQLETKNPFKKLYANVKDKFGSSTKPKLKQPKLYYDRGKVKPMNFVKAVVANDFYEIYTSKGSIYYLSIKDGMLLDQKKLKTKIDYVVFARDVILSGDKHVFLTK